MGGNASGCVPIPHGGCFGMKKTVPEVLEKSRPPGDTLYRYGNQDPSYTLRTSDPRELIKAKRLSGFYANDRN